MISDINDVMTAPEEVGFSSERLGRISDHFRRQVEQGLMVGVVTLVARKGKIAHFDVNGYANLETGDKLRKDSIFMLASQSKAITSTALMTLFDDGQFDMHEPLYVFIPEFKNLLMGRGLNTQPLARHATMQDIFRNTAGFPNEYRLRKNEQSLEELMTVLSKQPLEYQPGTTYDYGISWDVQARLVEVISGKRFDDFLKERIFEPLGMEDTGFWVPPEKRDRRAYLHNVNERGEFYVPQGQADPSFLRTEQCYGEDGPVKFLSGAGGMVSTAYDYWRFCQALINGGELEGERILSPRTVKYMMRDHCTPAGIDMSRIANPGYGQSLIAAYIKDATLFGSMVSEGTNTWGGGWGTRWWIDPREEIAGIVLTQQPSAMYPPYTSDSLGFYTKPKPGSTHGGLDRDMHNMVYQALLD